MVVAGVEADTVEKWNYLCGVCGVWTLLMLITGLVLSQSQNISEQKR